MLVLIPCLDVLDEVLRVAAVVFPHKNRKHLPSQVLVAEQLIEFWRLA